MSENLTQEQKEKIQRYEETKAKRVAELQAALSLLTDAGMKTHKGILARQSSVEYFRGVNFHVQMLKMAKQILPLLPSFKDEQGKPITLNSVEDSVAIGQHMIDYGVIQMLTADPGMMQPSETTPKFVIELDERQGGGRMKEKGIYTIIDTTTSGTQTMWLVLVVVVLIALMCFRLWPLWLKKIIWYISFYLLVFLIVTAVVRFILWGVLYHFGIEFWLFPNYFIDSNDPRDSFLPVYSYEIREDQFDVGSIILRLVSGALIVYLGYQFCQDEKNIDDLRDLAENGLTDLFEYGQDFVVGNALGDGSTKDDKNTTEGRERTETFAEKYRRELKKDLDDLGLDDEDVADSVDEASTEDSEPEGMLDLDALTKTEEEAEEEEAAAPDDKAEAKVEL